MSRFFFVLGGVRSGKSEYAELLAEQSGKQKIYIATAEIFDEEMRGRVDLHKVRRGEDWQLIEENVNIAAIIADAAKTEKNVILLDCLTLWLFNLLHSGEDIDARFVELVEVLKNASADIILVSNEVGLGIMPENALARKFADAAGIMNQKMAAAADKVILVAAGIPVVIKGG